MSAMYEVLRQLDEWRHLPAYQLERRVDVFFGMFLPKVIEKRFCARVDEVVPEFPLHKGLLACPPNVQSGPHHSVNVDFVVFGSKGDNKSIFLVELKTDMHSIDEEQLKNMKKAQCVGTKSLLCGVQQLALASESKRKYAHLVWKLLSLKCLCSGESKITSFPLEKEIRGISKVFEGLCVSEKWCGASVIPVVILPTEPSESDKKKIPCGFNVMTFDQFAETSDDRNQPFGSSDATVFADRLRSWAGAEAGRVSPWLQQR